MKKYDKKIIAYAVFVFFAFAGYYFLAGPKLPILEYLGIEECACECVEEAPMEVAPVEEAPDIMEAVDE